MKHQTLQDVHQASHSERDPKLSFTLETREQGKLASNGKLQETSSHCSHEKAINDPNDIIGGFPLFENRTTIEEFEKTNSSLFRHSSVTKHSMDTSFHKLTIKVTSNDIDSATDPRIQTDNFICDYKKTFPLYENRTTIEEFEKTNLSLFRHSSVTKHSMDTSFHKQNIKITKDDIASDLNPKNQADKDHHDIKKNSILSRRCQPEGHQNHLICLHWNFQRSLIVLINIFPVLCLLSSFLI